MRTLKVGIVIVGMVAASLAGAWGEVKSEAAKQALNTYQRETTELVAKHLAGMIEASGKYVTELRAAAAKLVTEGKTEESLEIGRLIKRIESRLKDDQATLSFLQPRAVFEVKGSGFKLKLLRNEATAYANRNFVWKGVPGQIDGWQFTQIAGGDTPDMNLQIKQAGVVFVAAGSTAELEKDGWQRVAQITFTFSDKSNNRLTLLSKQCKADEAAKIQHYGWAGTLVLVPDNQPAVASGL